MQTQVASLALALALSTGAINPATDAPLPPGPTSDKEGIEKQLEQEAKPTWTRDFRGNLSGQCIAIGLQQGVPMPIANVYYHCVVGELEKAVPVPEQATLELYTHTPDWAHLIQHCMDVTRKTFSKRST